MKLTVFVLALFSALFLFSCTQKNEIPESSHLTASQLAEKLAKNINFQQTITALDQRANELAALHVEALDQLSDEEWDRYITLNEEYPTLEELEVGATEADVSFVKGLFPSSQTELQVPMAAVLKDLAGYSYDPLGFTLGIAEVSRPMGIQLSQSCLEFCNDIYIDEWVSTFNQWEANGLSEAECYAAANAFAAVAFNGCMRGCNHAKSIQGN